MAENSLIPSFASSCEHEACFATLGACEHEKNDGTAGLNESRDRDLLLKWDLGRQAKSRPNSAKKVCDARSRSSAT